MLDAALTGLLTGLSLIVAIGAQNAFVLRQGIARQHVALVVAICALSDVLLIIAGVAGVGALVASHPTALEVCKWLGAAYLLYFAFRSFRSAWHAHGLEAGETVARSGVVTTTLALTWLNPHVYLDTVLMLGNIANQHGSTGRWWFAAGAGVASIAWFSGLGFGAHALAPYVRRPSVWRVIDILIGLTMIAVAVMLVLS